MVEGGFELFFRLRHLVQGISSHPEKTRCKRMWGGVEAFYIVWLLESHWISLNFNTLHFNMDYSPHFILPSSPTGLGVRGGVNRYSLWTVKPCYCAKDGLSFHPPSLGAIKMPSLLSNTTKGPHYAYRLSKFEHLQSACEAFLFICLHRVLAVVHGIFMASCRSFVVVHWLPSCSIWAQ